MSGVGRRARRLMACAGLVGACVGASAAPAVAGTWTSVASGTSNTITGIEFQSAARFWFVTSGGEIFKRQPNGSFARVASFPGVSLARIAFQPSGNIGLAVGDKGEIYRSTNAGASWAAVSRPSARNDACTGSEPISVAHSVRWAGNAAVYLLAGGQKVLRSANGSTWTDVNAKPGGGCKGQFRPGPGVTDAFFVPSSPNRGWMIDANFGKVFFAADVTSAASFQLQPPSTTANGYQQPKRLVGDPAQPSNQWAVAVRESGNASYISRTTDGWSTASDWRFGAGARPPRVAQHDIAFAGGTVINVGDNDQIETSTDGGTFFLTPSGTGRHWRSVDLADGNNAAVGGVGGALALSSNASALPDLVPPTGTLTPPKRVEAGWPTAFTVKVSDAGGSGLDPNGFSWVPSTASDADPVTGGATAKLTFPKRGFYTLAVHFRDRAGNAGSARASFTVVKPRARFVPPGGKSPIGRPTRGRITKINVRGQLNVPPNTKRSAACRGRITITVNGKRRAKRSRKLRYLNVATRKAKVSTRNCKYRKSVRFRRSRVKGRKIKVVLEFPGNTVVARSTYRKTLKLRK